LGQSEGGYVPQSGEVVYVVDDDVSVREAITGLLETLHLTVISFDSAESFLRHQRLDAAGCLILDLELPQMGGLELQMRLSENTGLPIIFLTGHGDIPSSVRAMKHGAIEFLTKPVDVKALTAAIGLGLQLNRDMRAREARLIALRNKLARFTPREHEVLPLLVVGFLNKQIAATLGIAEVTVQIHRGRIMQKMAAASFADLVRMCSSVGIPDPVSTPSSGDSVPDEGSTPPR
jgi:FixJ family two-component response regulator